MKTKESKYGRISYKESIFKSLSVGKPRILVQASVEKINTNNVIYRKNCNDVNNNDQPVIHTDQNYRYCKLK